MSDFRLAFNKSSARQTSASSACRGCSTDKGPFSREGTPWIRQSLHSQCSHFLTISSQWNTDSKVTDTLTCLNSERKLFMSHCWSHQPWITEKNYTVAAKICFLQIALRQLCRMGMCNAASRAVICNMCHCPDLGRSQGKGGRVRAPSEIAHFHCQQPAQ